MKKPNPNPKKHPPINKGEANTFAKLEDADIPLIIELIQSGIPCKEIGEKFDVTTHTIRHIKNGKTWRHITGGRCIKVRKPKYVIQSRPEETGNNKSNSIKA